MEEDIKILEEFINFKNINNLPYHLIAISHERLCEAIENLIARNKEYEKQLDLDYVDNNYISKSKIDNIIRRLQNEIASFNIEYDEFDVWRETFKRKSQIEILEELK